MDFKNMSLREKIGQTVILLCTPEEHIKKFGSIEEFMKRYPIGGLYRSGNLSNGVMSSVLDYEEVLAEYNKYSKIPLFSTGEAGMAKNGKVDFVSYMRLGAADDEDLAYAYGKALAFMARDAGLNWIFAPVVDLNLCSNSPITNVRAISEEPELAKRIACKIIEGIQDYGVAATAKHFPGPGPNEFVDPHLAPIDNSITREEWESTHGEVYREVIRAGVDSIMTGHQNMPAYQTEKVDGRYPGATMSKDLVNGLLREQLGYEGVVATDALVMGGFCGAKSLENQIRSLTSGNDVLLWPTLDYMDEMEKRILSGEIPMEVLDRAVERILKLKYKLGLFEPKDETWKYDGNYVEDVFRRIGQKCLTLVQDKRGLLPADKDKVKSILVVSVTPDDAHHQKIALLKDELSQYGFKTEIVRDIWTDELDQKQKEYDLVVFGICRLPHCPMGPMDFWGDNAASIWASNAGDADKTMVVSFGSPYSFKYYCNTDMTYVNAYASDEWVVKAVAEAIAGKIPFGGKSPVKL